MALTDEAYAEYSARHGYGEDSSPRQEIADMKTGKTRQQEFNEAGIRSKADAKVLCLAVRTASDTKCFLGHKGREIYANNRLNAIHISNPKEPHRSTIFINSDPVRTATRRLEEKANAERKGKGVPCHIRIGGSKALETDRVADRKAKEAVAETQQQTPPNQREETRQKGIEAEKTPRESVALSEGADHTPAAAEASQAQAVEQSDPAITSTAWTPEERAAKIAAEQVRMDARDSAEHDIGHDLVHGTAPSTTSGTI